MFGRPIRLSRLLCQLAATAIALPFLPPLIAIVSKSFQGEGAVSNYLAVLIKIT